MLCLVLSKLRFLQILYNFQCSFWCSKMNAFWQRRNFFDAVCIRFVNVLKAVEGVS
jgi:hypothetical protein